MVSTPPLPRILGKGLEILGLFKMGGAEKICYFRGNPKFKRLAVTLKEIKHLENISFSLG